ncbi:unnamed protein product [Thelazia callipaeda]|uniref:Ovule protein n=1 Tax=Thelazia callipaeda TaxID=103827 RepID=A0A0N5CUM4_THECL|nr:unnamed protein product [Thelazia callipaeda]
MIRQERTRNEHQSAISQSSTVGNKTCESCKKKKTLEFNLRFPPYLFSVQQIRARRQSVQLYALSACIRQIPVANRHVYGS